MSISFANSNGYLGIASGLRRRITAGELPARVQLPAIQDLARACETTPITVRRALRLLEEEGLVRVEHGVGTFVTDWLQGFDRMNLPSFAAEMAGRDLRTETRLLGRNLRAHHEGACRALQQHEGAPLVSLIRLRLVEGRAVAYQESFLPPDCADVVREYTPERSLYETLRARSGRVPVSARETLRAVLLSDVPSYALEVPSGAAGWLSSRLTSDAAGIPLVFDEASFPGERVALRVARTGQQSSLQYEMVRERSSHGGP